MIYHERRCGGSLLRLRVVQQRVVPLSTPAAARGVALEGAVLEPQAVEAGVQLLCALQTVVDAHRLEPRAERDVVRARVAVDAVHHARRGGLAG